MRTRFTRRNLLQGAAAAMAAPFWPGLARGADEVEAHGLSSFGDLALPADFAALPYVDPAAQKGGSITLQVNTTSGNQTFETFDTLNSFSRKGNGAAGTGALFDTLMSGSGDEPDSAYGLLCSAVRISADKLSYRFLIRSEAKFHDGSRVTAHDVAFSLTTLKSKGYYTYSKLLAEMASAEAESDDVALIRFIPERSRDAHLIVVGMPVFSEAWWKGREFDDPILEQPLSSGAYKVKAFEIGRYIEYERVADYWGRDLPINRGQNNFDRMRWEYFRERQVGFEAFKSGVVTFHRENSSRVWATGYDFPALRDGKVKRETLKTGQAASSQGWHLNTRREIFADVRVREAIGLAFDFEWTNKNVMYSSYRRTISYFPNTDMEAKGKPSPDELAVLEPLRSQVAPAVFDDVVSPPISDGSGSDRALLKRANDLLLAAGCKRDAGVLKLPNGKPLTFEFLEAQALLQPHTQPFQQNLKKLGIETTFRVVDPTQYKRRLDTFDFDVTVTNAGGTHTPSVELRIVWSSDAAKRDSSRNLSGISDPVVDALIEKIAGAKSRPELNTFARALDRVLRAGHYRVPMWFNENVWLAYWDAYSRPEKQPRYGNGAPDTWWWDAEKAKKIGL